jgi:hypothetical protein
MPAFFMKIIHSIRNLLLILFPLLSVYFGIRNIDFFDYILTDLGLASWNVAPYISRIALGFMPALVVMTYIYPKNSVKLLRIYALFALFIGIVSIVQVVVANVDRCYFCFFEKFRLSPYQSLTWFFLAFAAFLFPSENQSLKGAKIWGSLLAFIFISIPFVLNYPPSWAIYGEVGAKEVDLNVPMEQFFFKNTVFSRLVDSDKLSKGESLVCFASLTCPFCTRAANKLHILRKRNPNANCLLVLTGHPGQLERFTKRTQSDNVPCIVLNDSLFASITGGKVPRIFKVKNGKAIREFEYWAMDDYSLK